MQINTNERSICQAVSTMCMVPSCRSGKLKTGLLVFACLLAYMEPATKLAGQQPLPPKASLDRFNIPNDLQIDLVVSEPEIAQPVFCNFDERGRMWVVEYRQYPNPAGLKVVSKDRYYRNVYDKIPPAPPNHFRGKDRISIHEDTNGDGTFDSHKVFVDGLNIVTSVCQGRGGIWVLNPPYLLFYPDHNRDDIPDSNPVVHLSGFGLEDTHSCTNSLRFGPDGWLYAAQGSTVSASVKISGKDDAPVKSMGQLIWRYHPEQARFEIFAEGGGNAFGVEIDRAGRIFSGHNGGNTRGFHYPQGGYLRKGFTKHGALSNPFAFGFFPHMKHPNVERFTHNFVIYESNNLPTKYQGQLFGIEPLQGRVVRSEIKRRGSTFETRDLDHVVTTSDRWFKPVDIKLGPDGGIYVCDWYDDDVSHLEASQGKTDKTDGRIYRLIGRDQSPLKPFDLAMLTSPKLVELLGHPSRWHRQTALRVLGDRKDRSVLKLLASNVKNNTGPIAIGSLWATYQIGGLLALLRLDPLAHQDPDVRRWGMRLIGDEKQLPENIRKRIPAIIAAESEVETRTQFASSARRLHADDCFLLVQHLLIHEADVSDPYQPLLIWWAIESKCDQPQKLISWIKSIPGFWKNRMVRDHLAKRLIKRFTLPGTEKDFLILQELLQESYRLNPSLGKQLLKEFEDTANQLVNLEFPDSLLKTVSTLGGASLELRVRQKETEAVRQAIEAINQKQPAHQQRIKLILALGDIQSRAGLDSILKLLSESNDAKLQTACLQAMRHFDDPECAQLILKRLPDFSESVAEIAQSLVVSRPEWSLLLLESIAAGKTATSSLSSSVPRKMLFHDNELIRQGVKKHFGNIAGATDQKLRTQLNDYLKELSSGEGSPYEGKKLFVKRCGNCHRLYQNGGDTGPDLTAYQRIDLNLMLLHVVNPDAEIREGFENILFELDDGRIVSGYISENRINELIVRTADGSNVRIGKSSIENQKPVVHSLMPSGLLDDLTAQQRRDLFAFLRSTQPLNN